MKCLFIILPLQKKTGFARSPSELNPRKSHQNGMHLPLHLRPTDQLLRAGEGIMSASSSLFTIGCCQIYLLAVTKYSFKGSKGQTSFSKGNGGVISEYYSIVYSNCFIWILVIMMLVCEHSVPLRAHQAVVRSFEVF